MATGNVFFLYVTINQLFYFKTVTNMEKTLLIIIIYFTIVNIAAFISMGLDKSKARNHRWRIPESMLFFFAIIGGSIGSILGMHIFRHKTKHWYFVWGMPLILVVQLALIGLLIFNPNFNLIIM